MLKEIVKITWTSKDEEGEHIVTYELLDWLEWENQH